MVLRLFAQLCSCGILDNNVLYFAAATDRLTAWAAEVVHQWQGQVVDFLFAQAGPFFDDAFLRRIDLLYKARVLRLSFVLEQINDVVQQRLYFQQDQGVELRNIETVVLIL